MVATCLAKRAISELFTQQVRAPTMSGSAAEAKRRSIYFFRDVCRVRAFSFFSSSLVLVLFFVRRFSDSRIYQEIFASNNMRSRVLLLTLTDAVHCAFFPSTITS
jgi:hypothetical protein